MNKLPWYEYIDQYKFEDMIIDVLKEKFIITTRQAVHKYEEMCNEVKINDERCKIDSSTYSIRKYVVDRLQEQGTELN